MDIPPPPSEPIYFTLPLGRDTTPSGEPRSPSETTSKTTGVAPIEIEGPAWVDLARHHPDARATLQSLGVTEEIVLDALLMEETRPRAWSEGDALVAFLRGVNLNPDANPEDMVVIRVWMTRERIITLRALRVMAVDGTAERVRSGQRELAPGPAGATGAVLIDLARGLTERLEQTLEEIETRMLAAEEGLQEGERPQLATLRRKIVMIRRYVTPQRDVLAQLHSARFHRRRTTD
ncbi:MAG: CorA family divalent cation transporter, partial [Planctomycetota bacterium]